jgi:hypothetical protein
MGPRVGVMSHDHTSAIAIGNVRSTAVCSADAVVAIVEAVAITAREVLRVSPALAATIASGVPLVFAGPRFVVPCALAAERAVFTITIPITVTAVIVAANSALR